MQRTPCEQLGDEEDHDEEHEDEDGDGEHEDVEDEDGGEEVILEDYMSSYLETMLFEI